MLTSSEVDDLITEDNGENREDNADYRAPVVTFSDGSKRIFSNASGVGVSSTVITLLNADNLPIAMFNINVVQAVELPANDYASPPTQTVDPSTNLILPLRFKH